MWRGGGHAQAAVVDFVGRRLEQLLVDGGCCIEGVKAVLSERGACPAGAAQAARELQVCMGPPGGPLLRTWSIPSAAPGRGMCISSPMQGVALLICAFAGGMAACAPKPLLANMAAEPTAEGLAAWTASD